MKLSRLHIYLNENEKNMLENLKNQSGYTKNAIIRQMIKAEYFKNNPQENQKLDYLIEINKIFIDNIHKIGTNINQIAHQLNLRENINDDILKSLNENIQEVKEILSEYKKIIKEKNIFSILKTAKYKKTRLNNEK